MFCVGRFFPEGETAVARRALEQEQGARASVAAAGGHRLVRGMAVAGSDPIGPMSFVGVIALQ